MQASKIVPLALSVLLAVSGPASARDRMPDAAKAAINKAGSLAKKNDFDGAYQLLFPYLGSYGEAAKKALKVVEKRKQFRAALGDTVARAVGAQTAKSDIYHSVDVLTALRNDGLLPEDRATQLYTALGARAEALWSQGQIVFNLSENFGIFQPFAGPAGKERVFNAEITGFAQEAEIKDVQLKEVAVFLKTAPNAGALRQAFRQSLVGKSLSRHGIELYVQPLFPDLADDMLKDRTIYFSVSTTPRDLFFEDDMANALTSMAATFKPADDPASEAVKPYLLTLSGSNIVIDIKRAQERTRTVRYDYSAVDIAKAIAYMPQNATYLFDFMQGAIEMRYAAAIDGTYAGKPIKPFIVRGKKQIPYKGCSNARIENVFGGTTAATFIPNQNMIDMCGGGHKLPDDDELRKEVFQEIMQKLREQPAIQAVMARDPQTFGAQ